MLLYSYRWTSLVDAMLGGTVRSLRFNCVVFSALKDDALLAAVGCRGLQSIVIRMSAVPSGLLTDTLIRSSAANGLSELSFLSNSSDTPHRLSDDAVLDFFFRPNTTPGASTSLALEDTGITDTFLVKFFEVSEHVAEDFFSKTTNLAFLANFFYSVS